MLCRSRCPGPVDPATDGIRLPPPYAPVVALASRTTLPLFVRALLDPKDLDTSCSLDESNRVGLLNVALWLLVL